MKPPEVISPEMATFTNGASRESISTCQALTHESALLFGFVIGRFVCGQILFDVRMKCNRKNLFNFVYGQRRFNRVPKP
jgi:hypothetical protein